MLEISFESSQIKILIFIKKAMNRRDRWIFHSHCVTFAAFVDVSVNEKEETIHVSSIKSHG